MGVRNLTRNPTSPRWSGWQLSAKECLAIEDSQRGLAAANAAGLRCIVIPNGMTIGSAFDDAAMVISDAAALPGALLRFARTPPS